MDETQGRRERRRNRTRRALLDAALSLVAEHGLGDTRVEDVTRAADLGKGAFYNYFPSKTALVAALVQEIVADLLETCRSVSAPGSDVALRVRQLVRAHDAFFRTRPACQLLVHQAQGELLRTEGRDTVLADAFAAYLDGLGALLVPDDLSGAESPPPVRRDVAAAVAGAVTGYRSFDASPDRVGSAEVIEGVLAEGVAARLGASPARRSATDRDSSG